MPKGTEDHVGFFCPQSKQTCDYVSMQCTMDASRRQQVHRHIPQHTLFAGFNLSFSKIFCDSVFVARAIVIVCNVKCWLSRCAADKALIRGCRGCSVVRRSVVRCSDVSSSYATAQFVRHINLWRVSARGRIPTRLPRYFTHFRQSSRAQPQPL